MVAKFTSTVPVNAALIASVRFPGVTVAYPSDDQLLVPSPILICKVSTSTPASPAARTGFTEVQSDAVPRRI